MSHWWEYPITDVLPFSLGVYLRVLENYGAAVWPWQGAALALGVLGAALVLSGGRYARAFLLAALAIGWFLVSQNFFAGPYATVFWAAPYFSALFAVEGILLFAFALAALADRLEPVGAGGSCAWAALVALIVLGYPIVAWIAHGFQPFLIEIAGLFPDPTVAVTVAVITSFRGWLRWLAILGPLLWVTIQAAILVTLEAPSALVLPVVCVLAAAIALLRVGRDQRSRL